MRLSPLTRYPVIKPSHPGHATRSGENEKRDSVGAGGPQPITDLPEHENLHIGYNVTHDAGLIAMAFEAGKTSEKHVWIDPPAHRIGVDVMRLSVPDRFSFQAFVETVGDAVRTFKFRLSPPSNHLDIPSPFFRDAVPFPPCFSETAGVDVTIAYDSVACSFF